jgi:hypothetical protein
MGSLKLSGHLKQPTVWLFREFVGLMNETSTIEMRPVMSYQ